jgi:hypothetical protein
MYCLEVSVLSYGKLRDSNHFEILKKESNSFIVWNN